MMSDCIESPYSSRICELGTKSCDVQHTLEQQLSDANDRIKELEAKEIALIALNGEMYEEIERLRNDLTRAAKKLDDHTGDTFFGDMFRELLD